MNSNQRNPEVNIGVSEESQESNFQNACLHGIGEHAVSVAMYLPQSDGNLSEEELKAKLEKDLQPLTELGYSFTIAIGPENE